MLPIEKYHDLLVAKLVEADHSNKHKVKDDLLQSLIRSDCQSSIFNSFINCSLDPISKSIWLTDDDLELIDNQLSLRLKFQMGVRWQFTENEDGELSSENSED